LPPPARSPVPAHPRARGPAHQDTRRSPAVWMRDRHLQRAFPGVAAVPLRTPEGFPSFSHKLRSLPGTPALPVMLVLLCCSQQLLNILCDLLSFPNHIFCTGQTGAGGCVGVFGDGSLPLPHDAPLPALPARPAKERSRGWPHGMGHDRLRTQPSPCPDSAELCRQLCITVPSAPRHRAYPVSSSSRAAVGLS